MQRDHERLCEVNDVHGRLYYFVADPGTEATVLCRVCKSECEVTRDAYGPTSLASAMAKKHSAHDIFACSHVGEPWHEQALRLITAIEESPSARVAELMQQDLDELLAAHTGR